MRTTTNDWTNIDYSAAPGSIELDLDTGGNAGYFNFKAAVDSTNMQNCGIITCSLKAGGGSCNTPFTAYSSSISIDNTSKKITAKTDVTLGYNGDGT